MTSPTAAHTPASPTLVPIDAAFGDFNAEFVSTRRVARIGGNYRLLGGPGPSVYGPSADEIGATIRHL